jgi:hypothetical protein
MQHNFYAPVTFLKQVMAKQFTAAGACHYFGKARGWGVSFFGLVLFMTMGGVADAGIFESNLVCRFWGRGAVHAADFTKTH